ncbi:MAG: 50S ribosome-binding GTPase [Deltaproteobacteria bacterium]|jgi:GTPase SAR1 family protein|nr:50S ribosome-binding GTPase [Deltaproteobacteria bacterium]
MDSESFELPRLIKIGEDLINRSRSLLANAPSDKIQALVGRVPLGMAPPERLSLLFAGQYSAGKSTLLRVLTGQEDIAIGEGITTERTHTYDWGGIHIIDTPGVHTELRPDHDAITYQAIAEADLLVFVITNELFDSHLAEHFRKLAIEKDKAHEMLLVVNKMLRCARGNSLEQQKVIRENLRLVLTPFSPEDLRVCFIDAQAALLAETEPDAEFANIWWNKSGMDVLTQELNNFVAEKGLAARYTTALYQLEQTLQEALASESTGDEDIDALEELLLQRRRAILETRNNLPVELESHIHKAVGKVRREGQKIIDLLPSAVDNDALNKALAEAQAEVDQIAERLANQIQKVINEYNADLESHVSSIVNSQLGQELFRRLQRRISEATISPETVKNLKFGSDISAKFGAFLVRNSFNRTSGTLGSLLNLSQYSGTPTHSVVLKVGHFFGKNFRPWEAVKLTRVIATAGRVFSVVGTVLTIVLQIKEDTDAAQREAELKDCRVAVKEGFNEAALEIETHFGQGTKSFVEENYDAELQNIDGQLAELRDMQNSKSDLFIELESLITQTQDLIKKFHPVNSD